MARARAAAGRTPEEHADRPPSVVTSPHSCSFGGGVSVEVADVPIGEREETDAPELVLNDLVQQRTLWRRADCARAPHAGATRTTPLLAHGARWSPRSLRPRARSRHVVVRHPIYDLSSSSITVRPATSASDDGTDQTIAQLSRVLDVDERKVSRTARRVLGLSAAMVRDPALALSRNHCRQIAQALGKPDPWASASQAFALSNPTAGRRPVLKRDPCAKGELTFGSLPHGLWVHPEVPDGLGGMTPLRQRLGIVLAALGRAWAHDRCEGLPGRGQPRLAALAARRQRRHAVLPVVDGAGKRGPLAASRSPAGAVSSCARSATTTTTGVSTLAFSTTTCRSRSTRSRTPTWSAGPGRRTSCSSYGTKARCGWCTDGPGPGRRPCCGRRSRRAAASACCT